MEFIPPFALEVTDDQGVKHSVFVAHVAELKDRPQAAGGTIIRFSNGNALNVIENRHDLLNKLDYPPMILRESITA